MKPARGFASYHPSRKGDKGFIALIAVVFIASMLLGVAATLSEGVFFTRFDGLNAEYARIARSLAEGCLHAGELALADNFDYLIQYDARFDPAKGGVPFSLGMLYGKPAGCVLVAPTTTPTTSIHVRTFTVAAKSNFNGSFSTLFEEVAVTDPTYPTGRTDPLVVPGAIHHSD